MWLGLRVWLRGGLGGRVSVWWSTAARVCRGKERGSLTLIVCLFFFPLIYHGQRMHTDWSCPGGLFTTSVRRTMANPQFKSGCSWGLTGLEYLQRGLSRPATRPEDTVWTVQHRQAYVVCLFHCEIAATTPSISNLHLEILSSCRERKIARALLTDFYPKFRAIQKQQLYSVSSQGWMREKISREPWSMLVLMRTFQPTMGVRIYSPLSRTNFAPARLGLPQLLTGKIWDIPSRRSLHWRTTVYYDGKLTRNR